MSLVEVMIALGVGLALAGAAIVVYINSNHVFGVHANMASIQENGRFAMHLLREDVRLAGYWGLNYESQTIFHAEAIQLDNECNSDWVADTSRAVEVSNNANQNYKPCIPDEDYAPETDILVVRRVASTPISNSDIEAGSIYLHTSLTHGGFFIADEDGKIDQGLNVTESPTSTYELKAHAYYIRPWSRARDDGIPTLVRETISGETMKAEPLVEYVEDLQVTLGLDTDSDGNVDRHVKNGMSLMGTVNISTVIIEILIRASTSEADYTNQRSYQLGDRANFIPRDGYRRQLFRETIYIRNPARPASA